MATGKHRVKLRRHPGVTFAAAALITAVAAVSVEALVAGLAHADVDWTPIVNCESGGNPRAQNPNSTASGLVQFLDSSWLAYGGGQYASRAMFATPAQQLAVANHAYALSGLSPWAASRSCWGGKVNVNAPSKPAPPAQAAAPTGTYVVQPSDTLSTIAAHLGTSGGWQALAAANSATVPNPDVIWPGQRLRLP